MLSKPSHEHCFTTLPRGGMPRAEQANSSFWTVDDDWRCLALWEIAHTGHGPCTSDCRRLCFYSTKRTNDATVNVFPSSPRPFVVLTMDGCHVRYPNTKTPLVNYGT